MSNEHIISVDLTLCKSCGLCQKDCIHGLWNITNTGAEITSQGCMKCGHCVAICPHGAIAMTGFDEVPEELRYDMQPEADALLSMIKGRRSIRHFTQQDVPNEIVKKIIEAGRYTPTGRNRQGVTYVILRNNISEYEKLAVSVLRKAQPLIGIFYKQFRHFRIDDQFIFKGAPVAIVVKSDDKVDGALAASAMELVARSYGLGVLYNGMFPIAAKLTRKLRRKLSAASSGKVVLALAIGYPSVKYQRTAQREKPIVFYD